MYWTAFATIAAFAGAQQSPTRPTPPERTEIRKALDAELPPMAEVDAAIAEGMKPGPKLDMPTSRAIDPRAALERAPGGVEANILVEEGEQPTVLYYGSRDIPGLAALDATRVSTGPARRPGELTNRMVTRLGPNILLEGVEHFPPRATVLCASGDPDIVLRSDPKQPLGELDAVIVVMTRKVTPMLAGLEICSMLIRDGDTFTERVFLEGGDTLLLDSEPSTYRIRPLADAPKILRLP